MTASPKRSALYSILIHAAAIAVVLLATSGDHPVVEKVFKNSRNLVFLPPASRTMEGGGGGGQGEDAPSSAGRLARPALREFTPPVSRIRNPNPQLPVEPTILAPPDTPMPMTGLLEYGNPLGVIGPPSGGRGSGGGFGDGIGGGVGDRRGPGYGDRPEGGGVATGGPSAGPVTGPVLLWKTEPAYSEEARKGKIQGTVVLYIEIDARGQAQNVQVRQSVGFGLDERAMESVRHWRFRPAYRNGKPTTAGALVEVNFRLL